MDQPAEHELRKTFFGHRLAPLAGSVVMIDRHNLLPGAQLQFARTKGYNDEGPHDGGLYMTVSAAVMPCQFMGIADVLRRHSMNRLFQIGYHTRGIFDGGGSPARHFKN